MSARRFCFLRLSLFILLIAGGAYGDEEDAASWKLRGDEAMDAGRAAEALAAYKHAASLEPTPALDYNVGRALLAIGDFAGALDAFERYDQEAPADLKKKTYRLAEVISELRTKVASLVFVADDSSRIEAHAMVQGVDIGHLPHAPLRVNPGRKEIRIEREGFEPFVETLDFIGGTTTRVEVLLRPLRAVSHLFVEATPRGSYVFVDGLSRGVTPLELELTPGAHRVEIRASGYVGRSVELSLKTGESRRVDVQLARVSVPLTSRWWFWTGLGVIAVATTTIVVAGTVERSPSEGTLGTVRVP